MDGVRTEKIILGPFVIVEASFALSTKNHLINIVITMISQHYLCGLMLLRLSNVKKIAYFFHVF